MTDTPPAPPPAPPPAAWHSGVDAGVVSAWTNKGYDLADPVKTATAMWEQYKNLESHMGVPADKLVRLPKDASDEAGIKQMRAKLGVPNEPKDYDFAGIKFGDGTDLEAGFTDAMRGALHRAGVAKDSAPEVVKAVIKYLDDADASEKTVAGAKLAEQKAALAREWGTKHDENMLAAKQGARRLGVSPEDVTALEGVIGYHGVMEMFRKVGAGTSEDTFVGGGNRTGDPTTQQGAQERLKQLEADAAWRDRLFKGDQQTRREFDSLMMQIAGVVA